MFGKIDFEDALLGGVFTLSSLASTGLFTGGTFTPTSTSLSDIIWSSGATEITVAFVVSLAAIVGAYLTNRARGSGRGMSVNTDLGDIVTLKASYESYVALGTVAIVLLNGFNVAGFNGFITGSTVAGFAAFAVQLGGYYVFSWMG